MVIFLSFFFQDAKSESSFLLASCVLTSQAELAEMLGVGGNIIAHLQIFDDNFLKLMKGLQRLERDSVEKGCEVWVLNGRLKAAAAAAARKPWRPAKLDGGLAGWIANGIMV
ncbi:RNA-directed RNA polymerase catalytic subunit [Striga asiatica]|uniref:RNA-directed RNA polymerase catalytic subunit n=1 Tax=Striga asiatica TaxID=4170 RepID=A0A5A7RGJ0_STRAF|nr:RNA-directed RNA polymerase catalytic subunit [Striga asiatica]